MKLWVWLTSEFHADIINPLEWEGNFAWSSLNNLSYLKWDLGFLLSSESFVRFFLRSIFAFSCNSLCLMLLKASFSNNYPHNYILKRDKYCWWHCNIFSSFTWQCNLDSRATFFFCKISILTLFLKFSNLIFIILTRILVGKMWCIPLESR